MNYSPSSLSGYAYQDASAASVYPRRPAAGPSPAAWAQQEWNPAEAIRSLLRSWRLIVGWLVLVLAVTWAVLSVWPRSYTAETLVLLDPRNQPNLHLDEVLAGFAPDDQTLSSEVLILQSPGLAAGVIGDLALAEDPDLNPAASAGQGFWALLVPEGVYQRLFRSAGLAVNQTPEAALESVEVQVLQAFADRLEVERAGRSHAISIAFTSSRPERAADVANRLAERYLESQLSTKYEVHGEAQDWLSQRVGELQENVEVAERAVEEYRTRSGLIDSNGMTVNTQQMGEINSRLIGARAETAAARARLAQVNNVIGRNGDALSAAEVLSSPLIHRLKEQEVEVQRQRADLAQEYGARHPRMLSVEAELADIRDRIMAEVRQIVSGLKNEVAVAVAQESALAADLERVEGKTAEQNHAEVRLRALEREAEASRNLLETFLARIKESSNQEAIQRSDAKILSHALPPAKPSAPRVLLVMAAAAFLAFFSAAAFVLVSAAQRHSAGTPAAFREQTGVRVLACLPKARPWMRGVRAAAERALHLENAAMQAAVGLSDAKTIMVASPSRYPGSGPVAVALAKILARQREEVLLVDGQVEGAVLSGQLRLRDAPGLADLLAGDDARSVPTAPSGVDGLRFMSAGRETADFARPLAPEAFGGVWRSLQSICPRLLIHGGPLLGSVEARMFAAQCDAVILVLPWGETPMAAVAEAVAVVQDAGGTLAGVVLVDTNRDPATEIAVQNTRTHRAATSRSAMFG